MAMDLGGPKGKPGRASPNMNVTPLVDVVLVLLIIFMVVTPLMAKQFWLHLPNLEKKDEPAEPDDSNLPLMVRVNEKNEILINREVVSDVDFSTRLRRMLAARGDRTVFFDADEEAAFGKAVGTMDLARAGGASTIVVLTQPLAPQ